MNPGIARAITGGLSFSFKAVNWCYSVLVVLWSGEKRQHKVLFSERSPARELGGTRAGLVKKQSALPRSL